MIEARDTLLTVVDKKTPLAMLLVLKTCMDQISDAITQNIRQRRLDFGACRWVLQMVFVVMRM